MQPRSALNGTRPRLTILTPVHNEEANLGRYASDVKRVLMSRPDLDVTVLLVDDGSSDQSWAGIQEVCNQDSRFRGIRLSRNFGSHTAIWAAFNNADPEADVVAILACDLQDPAEVVVEFVDRWRAGADIVWGVRHARKEAGWRVLTSRLFGFLLRRYAMPRGSKFTTGSFLLADRQVVAAIRQMHERNRITFALVAWTGFEQDTVSYDRRPRVAGQSGWSVAQMFKAMYDAFIGFSALPIRLMTIAAACAFVVGVALSIYLLVDFLVGHPVAGWTSQMLIVSAFFAVQFSLTAIMGEYLYRIYAEVLRRPGYFISDATFEESRQAPPTGPDSSVPRHINVG